MSAERGKQQRLCINDERCVICGNYVPEQGMVCPLCERKIIRGEVFVDGGALRTEGPPEAGGTTRGESEPARGRGRSGCCLRNWGKRKDAP